MSIRFSTASSALRSLAVALILATAALPAAAQLDAVTEEAKKDPFILVRLAALSLETPAEQGEALAGLVEAELARGDLPEAERELRRITDGYWLSRSLIKMADYQAGKQRIKPALAALEEAVAAAAKAPPSKETETLFHEIAVRRNALGDAEGAVATARRIKDARTRIEALLEMGRPDPADKTSKGNRAALIEASKQTQLIKDNESEVARLLLSIGEAQTRLGDSQQADKTLAEARRMILDKEFTGREQALAQLAAAETQAGDQTRAMILVRSIVDPERRVRSLASIARAIGEQGRMDAAVTLFTFARETTEGISDESLR
jgi:tetratricopeptide (TPR) repeat protein